MLVALTFACVARPSSAEEPRSQADAAGTPTPGPIGILDFTIADADGRPMPGRLTFVRESDPSSPLRLVVADGSFSRSIAVRGNIVYAATGRGRVGVAPGRYRVIASRGLEWSLESASLLLSASVEREFRPRLRHEVDTTGYVSADLHIHTATHSGHGDASVAEQLMALAGEGVEFAVASEHNANADYRKVLAELGLSRHLMTITGNEVSTGSGHWNAFPLDPKRAPVSPQDDTEALFASLRKQGPSSERRGVLLQVNHPRSTVFPYFTLQGLDPVTGEAAGPHYSPDFDLIEVLNGNAGWGYYQSDPAGDAVSSESTEAAVPGTRPDPEHEEEAAEASPADDPNADADAAEATRPIGSSRHSVLRDWFHLLDRGHRYTAVGNSDSHSLGAATLPGIPRNFVRSASDAPSERVAGTLSAALRGGHSFTTTGPFVTAQISGASFGEETASLNGEVELQIRVQAASWISVDRVKVVVNGSVAHEIVISAGDETGSGEADGADELDAGERDSGETASRPPVNAVLRLDTRINLQLPGDSWVVVLVEGDTPLEPIAVPLERPALPIALTNPIRVKVGAEAQSRDWLSPWQQAGKRVAKATAAELATAIASDAPAADRARLLLAALTGGDGARDPSDPAAATALVELVATSLRDTRDDARDVRLVAARGAEWLGDPRLKEALSDSWSAAADDPYQRAALLRAYAAVDPETFRERLLVQIDAGDSAALSRYGAELARLWPDAYLRDWSVLGYFPNASPNTLTRRNYGPEFDPDRLRRYPGKHGGEIGWKAAQTTASGFLDLAPDGVAPALSQHAIAYAQVYLYAGSARTAAFAMGADDGCRVYLNGSLIYADPTRHVANPWQHFGRLRLRRGWNRLLVKLENGVGDFGLFFQLFDPEVRAARAPD